MAEQIRQVDAASLDRMQTVVKPTSENFMDVIRAIGAMPTAKLHGVYAELFGHDPMVTVTRGEGDEAVQEDIFSPNRKQLVRVCQYGYQYLFYVTAMQTELPSAVAQPTLDSFAEELTESSPRAGGKRVSRGPTIKQLVLDLLVGEPDQEYEDPETGEQTTGNVVPANDAIYDAVHEKFPDSKFDKTHLAWYLTQYRNGRFEKDGYGGDTGKPLGVLTRDIDKAAAKRIREIEKAKKAAEKAAKAEKKVEVEVPAGGDDPLNEFDSEPDEALE